MIAQVLETEAVVLDRQQSGDNWMLLTCFSAERGNLVCMQRQSRRASAATPVLDLFDEVQLTLETRNHGRTWFVKEATTLARRTALGRSYESLRHACRFARVLARNAVPEESRLPVRTLLARAITAWETHQRPDSVYFKCIYLLTRDEGYPVRESWWQGLESADRALVDSILGEPAAAQTTSEADVARLTSALEAFVRDETDIRLDS